MASADHTSPDPSAVTLRPHRPGDLGWVVHRHGALYAQEYGWDIRFEGMVAGIVAHFIEHFDPAREACWMAERAGPRGRIETLGSVTVARLDEHTAKLRLLYVEPAARGLGLGKRLVAHAEAFARQAGYQRMSLWTNANLAAARGIYLAAGYQLIASEPHDSYGHRLVGETWEKTL
jgi:GNAT superfamily N-acetyltransferase